MATSTLTQLLNYELLIIYIVPWEEQIYTPLPRPPYLGAHFYIFVILAEVAINFYWTHYEFSLVFHAANTMSSGVATIVLTRWQCSFFDRLFLSYTTYRVESCQQQRRFSSCKHLSLVSFVQNSFKFFDS